MGIRLGPNGTLFVADAYLGVFEVNPTTGESGSGEMLPSVVREIEYVLCVGEVTRLVSGGQVVAGRKLSFINDLAVTQDGKKLYFTSSSSRWQRRDYMHLIMEATADGRYEGQADAALCQKVKQPRQHLVKLTDTKRLALHQKELNFKNLFHFLPACWNTTLRPENCQW